MEATLESAHHIFDIWFAETFYYQWILNFVKALFFFQTCIDMMIRFFFLFQCNDMVNYVVWFLNVDSNLHSRNKPYLIRKYHFIKTN